MIKNTFFKVEWGVITLTSGNIEVKKMLFKIFKTAIIVEY